MDNFIKRSGKKYASVKYVAEKWGVSPSRVREYCRNGEVRAMKENGNKWYIELGEKKPLTKQQIKSLLSIAKELQNKQEDFYRIQNEYSESDALYTSYKWLERMEYVKPFEKNNQKTYVINLTEKGEETISDKIKKICNVVLALAQLMPVLKNWLQTLI